MDETERAVSEGVERATLPELESVDIEDVYVHRDYLLRSRPTPMDLYYRWESQQWSARAVDFTEDKVHWDSMTGAFEGFRTELQRSFTLFFVGEQAVTDTLSPLVHAAPDEQSRIFLSTQLVDEVEETVLRLLEDACRTVASPDRRFAVSPALTPPNLLINPYEVAAFSTHSLTKRLRVAGVSARVCDEIARRAERYYQAAWDEYEDLHGEEHPYRFFDAPVGSASGGN